MTLVESSDDYQVVLRAVVNNRGPIAVDLETTGTRIYQHDVVRGVSVAVFTEDGTKSWYVPVSHPDSYNVSDPAALIDALRHHSGPQVFHNAVGVDWAGLATLGTYPLPTEYYDTQVGAWLQDENQRLKLKELAAGAFGEDAKAEQTHLRQLRRGRSRSEVYRELRSDPEWANRPAKDARVEAQRISEQSKKDWGTFTAQDIAAYAARDAELTLKLRDLQIRRGVSLANDREHRFQGVLYRMRALGIKVDQAAVEKQRQYAQQRLDELASPYAGINLASTQQLASMIYSQWGNTPKHFTASGAPSTSREALEELSDDPRVRDLLEYKRHAKAMSGYYVPLAETVASDGRIHASFSSTRTHTGRLSCSDPNLQTIPRGDTLVGVRDVFIAEDGYELWEYDLKQAELRVQASFSGDLSMQQALLDGADLHNRTAELVFGPDFTPLQRRLAKNLNFGFSYGIGPRKFARYMVAGTPVAVSSCAHWDWEPGPKKRPWRCRVCHVCQAAQILADYREAQPKLVRLMTGLERIAKAEGRLPLHVPGRYRHFRSPGVIVPYYTALNAVVQGGVAEFMKDIMLEVEPLLPDFGSRLVLQVHDSLVCEVEGGNGQRVGELLQRIADDINPFSMRMEWDSQLWSDHV